MTEDMRSCCSEDCMIALCSFLGFPVTTTMVALALEIGCFAPLALWLHEFKHSCFVFVFVFVFVCVCVCVKEIKKVLIQCEDI